MAATTSFKSRCGATAAAGDVLASPDPTYSLYPVLAELADVRFVTVPWEPGWSLPADALLATDPRAIFFANPNAPSGTWVPPSDVGALAARTDALVLVDEAYVDFADADCMGLLGQPRQRAHLPHVEQGLRPRRPAIRLRSGASVDHRADGQGEGQLQLRRDCHCGRCAALEDQAYARQQWALVHGERTRVTAELERRGFSVLPSRGNFVLAATPGAACGRPLYDALKTRGVLVRFFDKPGLDDKLRITIGTPDENAAMLAALDLTLADSNQLPA